MSSDWDPSDLASWHRDLLRYGHRLTGDADMSEDLAQEAMLRLLRLQPVARPLNPRAWLFRVVTNLVRDRARTLQRMERKHLLIDAQEPSVPSAEYERNQAIARVRAVLEHLPARDREMLILRESGFQHREIAEIVGVKARSVSVLLARALERFKTAFIAEASV